MQKEKALRIVVAATICAAGSILIQHFQSPIRAAARNADPVFAPAPQAAAPSSPDPGAQSYLQHCAMCHGAQRQGNPPQVPSLVGVGKTMTDEQIADLIHKGKAPMPPFPDIKGDELDALLKFLTGKEPTTTPAATPSPEAADDAEQAEPAGPPQPGRALFQQNCSFCHGRDAMGGETGPDLTRSKLVTGDKTGDKILAVVREGRPGTRMPAFNFSSEQMQDLLAFIRARVAEVAAHPGGRRGVEVSDLQTGDADAGKAYFDGAGGCAKCHSPTGDLARIASRYDGLALEMRMLYPWHAKSTVTVSLPSGEKISGTLAYLDEFTVALRDASGTYRSWLTSRVRYKVDAPVNAHVDQFPKYTDDDIHNLMAYLQTLR